MVYLCGNKLNNKCFYNDMPFDICCLECKFRVEVTIEEFIEYVKLLNKGGKEDDFFVFRNTRFR